MINPLRVNLVKQLVARDLKARYKVAVLGFFWSLLRPLFLIAIFTVVFNTFLRFEISYKDIHYSVFLITGILPWAFLAESLTEVTSCLVANANLIRKVSLPRMVFPISVVLSKLVNLLLAMVVMLPVVYALGGVRPSWTLLLLPVVLLTQLFLALGLGFLFAIANVYYRDMSILIDVILTGWFYMTPVFYPLRYAWVRLEAHPLLKWVYMANPMTPIIYAYRRVFLHTVPQSDTFPLPLDDSQAFAYFIGALVFSVCVLVLGAWVYGRNQRYVEDYL